MEKYKVFMIMPFEDEFFEVYNMLQKTFEEKFQFSNAGDEDNQQNILKDIIEPICEADIILADLTGVNPNVLYELGIAHTLNKKCIVITKDELSTLPFDLKQYRAKNYDTHFIKFNNLVEYLEKNFIGAIDNSVRFGNPVTDFMNANSGIKIENINKNVQKLEEKEKGFLDFIVEIEEDMNNMAENTIEMTSELNNMNISVNEITARINNVGGNGKASYVRKEAKNVADCIMKFENILKECNNKNLNIWNRVEVNTLSLLDNEFILKKERLKEIEQFIIKFIELKNSISVSNKEIEGMKKAILMNKGIEKTLSQSINAVEIELDNYLTSMEQTVASIERIEERANIIKYKLEK